MAATGNVQLNIGGDVSGQIAIGNNNLQIQNHGGIVNVLKPSSRSPFRKRSGPIRQRPRAFSQLLDRAHETSTIQSSIQNGTSVSIFGEGGIGKTTFLSHVAYLPEAEKFPHGVVYLYVKEQGLDDLLQMLFDTFYSSGRDVMPTAGQLRHHLQGIRAVILLDDLTLTREEAQALITIMPLSCFVIASLQRSLWGDGAVILLEGLPEEEQVELFAREIGRPLSEAEKTDALIICYHLQGHPLKIIQAAALITTSGRTISEVKRQFLPRTAPFDIARTLLDRLSEPQRKVLALLGACGGALIPLSILSSLLKLPGTQEVIRGLIGMGLVWSEGPRYGVVAPLVGQIERIWNLSSWEDSLVNYLSNWITQQPQDAFVEDASDLLVQAVQIAGQKNRWPQVLAIGRALERILILNRRWQKWLDILNWILNAARAISDQYTEGWALHQLGTRAMCLNHTEQARQFLTEALQIRQAIGDKAGLAATEHNLKVLRGPSVPLKTARAESEIGRYLSYGFGGMAGLASLVLIILLLWRNYPGWILPPLPTQVPVATATPFFTVLPSSTPIIITATRTPSPTETGTATYTFTPTSTYTITPSFTPSITPSRTPIITLSHTPTVTAFVQPPGGVCPLQTFRYHSLPSVSYIPPKVGSGDADFAGHGPSIATTVTLEQVDARRFRLSIYMYAIEANQNGTPVPDNTTAVGTTYFNDFIVLPSGYVYYDTIPANGLSSYGQYIDTDRSVDVTYPLYSEGPVNYFEFTGDTDGNEAGTETRVVVYFKTVQIRAYRSENCLTPTPSGPVIE